MNAYNLKKNYLNHILREIPAAVALLILTLPLFFLIIDGIQNFIKSPAEAINHIVPTGSRFELLARSISLSAAASIFCIFSGMIISILFWRYAVNLHTYFILLLMVLMLVPNYIHAQSWIFFLDKLNNFLAGKNIIKLNFNGFFAAWWVMVNSFLPLAAAIMFLALKAVKAELIETAVIYSKDIRVLFKIIIPQLMPSVFTAANLIFVLCLTDYGIPSLFGINVYPLHIFAQFSADTNTGRAFLISLPLLSVAVLIIAAAYNSIRNISFVNLQYESKSFPFIWPLWFKGILVTGGLVLAMQVLIPFINLLLEMGPFSIITAAYSEIKYTMIISMSSALLCICPAFVLSEKLLHLRKCRILWWFALAMPFVIPASLTGMGIISLCSKYIFSGFYGSLFMPILANVTRFLPVAVLIVFSQLKGIDSNLFEAAKVFQTNPLKTLLRIKLPLLMPSLIAAFGAVFALSATELGAAVILAPPGKNTLTMKIYNYLHYGASETVAVLCFVMLVITLVAGVIAVSAYLTGKRRKCPKKY